MILPPNILKSLGSVFGLLLLLFAPTISTAQKISSFKGEVMYHVFQRSFYDSNGDRHGDLQGLRQKLDYLQDLGVTSILLLPLYEADCYHNYFASDFEKIDTEYGTMQDYIDLVKDVHRRGMKIYLDMETQYVTSDHLWWKDAVGNLKSEYSNFILFQDEAHEKPSTIVYDLTELNSYDGKKIRITTVNLRSKEVLDYNIRLFRYFVDPNNDGKFDDGADGFRLDHAMDHLDKKPELTNLFEVFWNPLITEVKKVNPNIIFTAEQADWLDYGFDYLTKAGVDRVFGFGLWYGILTLDKQKIIQQADTILRKTPAGKNQIIFIENHDIDRSATVLKGDRNKQRVAAAISLLIGGIPSLYYGQEIGMLGDGGFGIFGNTDGNDIPTREAFEWSQDAEAKGMAIWYKDSGPWWDKRTLQSNDGISVEEQQSDPASLLNFYKEIIRLKQSNPALASGQYQTIANDNTQVYTFLRSHGKHKALVAVNLSHEPQRVRIGDGTFSMRKPKSLYGDLKVVDQVATLAPYQIAVWSIQ